MQAVPNEIIIMDVIEDTVVDGPGMRITVYSAGCIHHCQGCHNPQSWNKANGHSVEIEKLVKRIIADEFANVTFSGGDPLEQVENFTELARQIKVLSNKNIWCYTGYLFENIQQSPRLSMILPYIDVLVDGLFIQELADRDLMFRGSSNQRLIDVKETLRTGVITQLKYDPRPTEFID